MSSITELRRTIPPVQPLPIPIEPDLYGAECDADNRVKSVVHYLRVPLTDWGGIPNRNRISKMLDGVQVVPQDDIADITHIHGYVKANGAYIYPFSKRYPDTILIAREAAANARPSELIDVVIEELAHSYYQPVNRPLTQVLPQNSQIQAQLAADFNVPNLNDVMVRGYGFFTFFDIPSGGRTETFTLEGMAGKEEYRASIVKQLFLMKLLQSTQFSASSRDTGLLKAVGALLKRTNQSGVLDGVVNTTFEAQIATANIFMFKLLQHNGGIDGKTIENLFNPLLKHLHDNTVYQFGSYVKSLGNPELYNLYQTQIDREAQSYNTVFKDGTS